MAATAARQVGTPSVHLQEPDALMRSVMGLQSQVSHVPLSEEPSFVQVSWAAMPFLFAPPPARCPHHTRRPTHPLDPQPSFPSWQASLSGSSSGCVHFSPFGAGMMAPFAQTSATLACSLCSRDVTADSPDRPARGVDASICRPHGSIRHRDGWAGAATRGGRRSANGAVLIARGHRSRSAGLTGVWRRRHARLAASSHALSLALAAGGARVQGVGRWGLYSGARGAATFLLGVTHKTVPRGGPGEAVGSIGGMVCAIPLALHGCDPVFRRKRDGRVVHTSEL